MRVRQKVWYFIGLGKVQESRLDSQFNFCGKRHYYVDDPKGITRPALYVGQNCFSSKVEAINARKKKLFKRMSSLYKQIAKIKECF